MSKRSTLLTVIATSFVTAVLVAAVPAVAGGGDPLILGQNNNGGAQTTKATANVSDGPGFQFTNPAGGVRAAVRINTDGLAPPFATNSTGKVKKFNADFVDSLGGEDLQVIAAADERDLSLAGDASGTAATVDIAVPRSGLLLMQGAIDVGGIDSAVEFARCSLTLDGASQDGSDYEVDGGDNTDSPCVTMASANVAAGTHTVNLIQEEFGTLAFDDTNLQVTFVPGSAQATAVAVEAPSREG